MTGLIRTVLQVGIARLLASPLGDWAYQAMELSGITEERLADYLTVVVLGAGVAVARIAKSTDIGAKVVEWANLILSLGKSAAGPTYEPKHLLRG